MHTLTHISTHLYISIYQCIYMYIFTPAEDANFFEVKQMNKEENIESYSNYISC